jgi:hypothetical protein
MKAPRRLPPSEAVTQLEDQMSEKEPNASSLLEALLEGEHAFAYTRDSGRLESWEDVEYGLRCMEHFKTIEDTVDSIGGQIGIAAELSGFTVEELNIALLKALSLWLRDE